LILYRLSCWLDLRLNYDKSLSMRVGPRFDRACLAITNADGKALKWVKNVRNLGICLVSSRRSIRCLESNAILAVQLIVF
jgi:hypothetical protein